MLCGEFFQQFTLAVSSRYLYCTLQNIMRKPRLRKIILDFVFTVLSKTRSASKVHAESCWELRLPCGCSELIICKRFETHCVLSLLLISRSLVWVLRVKDEVQATYIRCLVKAFLWAGWCDETFCSCWKLTQMLAIGSNALPSRVLHCTSSKVS